MACFNIRLYLWIPRSRSRCLWLYFRQSWYRFISFDIYILFQRFIHFHFLKISNYLLMTRGLGCLSSRIKLSSWWSAWNWSITLLPIKPTFDKMIKFSIRIISKWNKLKEVIEVFISENSIINALKFTVQVNWSFEFINIYTISKTSN